MTVAARRLVTEFDRAGLRATRHALGGTPAVPVARALSGFGEHAAGWVALGVLGWSTGRRRHEWAAGLSGVVAAHAAGVLLKRLVRRPRPDLPDAPPLVSTASRLSFPSAHSCSTAAAAVGYAPLVGRAPGLTATGAMLTARVLLGVHYPSDVLAGAALGSGVAWVVRRRLG